MNTSDLRPKLKQFDDTELDILAMDHFPTVYDKFGRGMRRDEKINLLLDHCRRNGDDLLRLASLIDNLPVVDEAVFYKDGLPNSGVAQQDEYEKQMSNNNCKANTTSGKRCALKAGPSGYCHLHDPAKIAERAARQKVREEAHQKAWAKGERLREVVDLVLKISKAKGWQASTISQDKDNWQYATVSVERNRNTPLGTYPIIGSFDITVDEAEVEVSPISIPSPDSSFTGLHKSIMSELGQLPWRTSPKKVSQDVTTQPTSSVIHQIPRSVKGQIDFAIITIREDEFTAVLERFAPEPLYFGDRRYVIGRVNLKGDDYYQVAIARSTDQGEGPAQDLARDMIEQLDPEWLLVVGIAGGLPNDDFTLGDVVIAKRILDFSVKAISEGKPPEYDVRGWAHPLVERACAALPAMRKQLEGEWNRLESIGVSRPEVQLEQEDNFYGDDAWMLKVKTSLERHFKEPRSPRFTTAVIAATEELVKSPALVQLWLQDARSMRAVEMELAGVYQAARRSEHQYPVLAIRGISDIVGFKRDSDWTDYACHSAAAFAYTLVRSGFLKSSKASQTGISAGQSPSDNSRSESQNLPRLKRLQEEYQYEKIPFDTPEADKPYMSDEAPTGEVNYSAIPFSLPIHHTGQGHKVIEVKPAHPRDCVTKEIRPAEIENAIAIYVLLSAGDTRLMRGGERFNGKEIGRLEIYFNDSDKPQIKPLRLGIEIREWVSGHEKLIVVSSASEAEQVWQSKSGRYTLDMICIEIDNGPRYVSKLVVVGECPWLPESYTDALPSVRISGVTYKKVKEQ